MTKNKFIIFFSAATTIAFHTPTNMVCDSSTIQMTLRPQSGDGTVIFRSLHVVKSPKDHTIAILNIPEKYKDLATSLEDICLEASHLDTIKLNRNTYKTELFTGGDMKFLLLFYILDPANAQHSCLCCKCPVSE